MPLVGSPAVVDLDRILDIFGCQGKGNGFQFFLSVRISTYSKNIGKGTSGWDWHVCTGSGTVILIIMGIIIAVFHIIGEYQRIRISG